MESSAKLKWEKHGTNTRFRLQLLYWNLPAEKGRNAGFFLKFPVWSRKCWGLKDQGVVHCFSSFSTECKKGIITVSCWRRTVTSREHLGSGILLYIYRFGPRPWELCIPGKWCLSVRSVEYWRGRGPWNAELHGLQHQWKGGTSCPPYEDIAPVQSQSLSPDAFAL